MIMQQIFIQISEQNKGAVDAYLADDSSTGKNYVFWLIIILNIQYENENYKNYITTKT